MAAHHPGTDANIHGSLAMLDRLGSARVCSVRPFIESFQQLDLRCRLIAMLLSRLDWPGVARTALGVVAALLCAAYAAKVVQTFIKRSQLISAYNARARQWRLPTSQESNISRTRTDKLQRDVDDLQEKAQSFSQRPTGGAGATGVGPSRSMRSLGSVDKQRYDPGSNAPSGYSGSGAAALPFSVAHQPHYGSPAQYNMMPRFG